MPFEKRDRFITNERGVQYLDKTFKYCKSDVVTTIAPVDGVLPGSTAVASRLINNDPIILHACLVSLSLFSTLTRNEFKMATARLVGNGACPGGACEVVRLDGLGGFRVVAMVSQARVNNCCICFSPCDSMELRLDDDDEEDDEDEVEPIPSRRTRRGINCTNGNTCSNCSKPGTEAEVVVSLVLSTIHCNMETHVGTETINNNLRTVKAVALITAISMPPFPVSRPEYIMKISHKDFMITI